MAYAAAAISTFTNLYYGECYPRTNHSVVASYWIPSGIGTVRVRCSCGGAVSPNPPPSFGPGPIGGTQTFTITHNGTGPGHTIITDIVVGTTTYPGDEVTVSIGDPCPVGVRTEKEYAEGFPIVDSKVAPSGVFNGKFGNAVHLLVEDPPVIGP
jgi:hypothetical protein